MPATGLTNSLVSNVVEAVSAAASVGPLYWPAHVKTGHEYASFGSKWSIGPLTSVPTVVGFTNVSRVTVTLWFGSADHAKSPDVVAEPTGCWTARTSPQPLT